MKTHLLYTLILALCASLSANAQSVRDSVLVHFRVSRTELDTSYMSNAASLAAAQDLIHRYEHEDSTLRLSDIRVIGAASPEGSVSFNQWLSHRRAERIFDYMQSRIVLPDSLTSFEFVGRDWAGLRTLVEADSKVPFRDDVLSALDVVLENVSEGETQNQRNLEKIKALHDGIPYRYMLKNLFPTLRASKLMLTFRRPYPALDFTDDLMCRAEVVPPRIIPVEWYAKPQGKPFYMALKSNMLSDILAIPHIGAEFYLGKNISVVGNWWYGWWKTDRTHRYWRSYGGDLALRWWFGKEAHKKPLTGHHIGLYGGVVTYDFEWGGTGYMGGLPGRTLWDRCNWFGGVEYGYALPVARRVNIDFTLGLGYMGGKYIVYDPMGKWYVYKETKNRRWVGPTKLEISLTWLLGRGNFNEKKGGRR